MRKYNLETSMSDRADFDQMAYECGQETARTIDEELPFDIKSYAESTFSGGIDSVFNVDDRDEAEARWVVEFVKGFKQQVLDQVADALDDIAGPVQVFDTRQESFGAFDCGSEAAEAIRNSNLDWWAMAEYPTYELGE